MAAKKSLRPGNPVRNSKSGQPIMVVMDMLGRRWSLRILWFLRNGEKQTSRMIQKACEITSPNVLNSRLKELREAGVVALEDSGGYYLTKEGKQLLLALAPVADWADQWARKIGRDDLACFSKARQKS